MRALLWFAIAACHPGPPAPLPMACNPARVGRVVVDGATPAEVAPLAVLDGTLDDPARSERIAGVATELLRARGYARARIALSRRPGCGVELHVAVDRGPKFRIARIAFAGAPADDLPPSERLAALEDALGQINAVGGAYLEDRMIRALAALTRRYRDAGWLDATIDAPRASFDAAHAEIEVVIPLHAGRRFRIGSIHTRGAGSQTRAAVVDALGLRGGDWYDGSTLRRGIDRARRQLDRRIELRALVDDDRDAIDLIAVVGAPR